LSDLKIAKDILEKEGVTLVIVKDGIVLFKTNAPGIKGLLHAIEVMKAEMFGASVADSVVGRAAALLFAYSKVKEVYAAVLSREGLKILKASNIKYEFKELVQRILNKSRTDICPFEKFSLSIKSPAEAYEKLRKFEESISRQ